MNSRLPSVKIVFLNTFFAKQVFNFSAVGSCSDKSQDKEISTGGQSGLHFLCTVSENANEEKDGNSGVPESPSRKKSFFKKNVEDGMDRFGLCNAY